MVFQCYQLDKDKALVSSLEQNFHRFIGHILENRYDGAFVRISMDSGEVGIPSVKME